MRFCLKENLDKDTLSDKWKFDSPLSQMGYQGKGVEWRIIVCVCVRACMCVWREGG